MLSSILSLGLLALFPLVAAQASYVSHGCISSFSAGTAQPTGAGSLGACDTACSATKYFYYRAGATVPCQCSDTDPYRYGPTDVTFVNSQDSGGTCSGNTVSVYMRQTTFRFGGCFTSATANGTDDRIISKAGSLAIVAQYCAMMRTVVFSLDPTTRTYNGYCGGLTTNIPSGPQVCSENSGLRYYTHSAPAAASQLARKRARLARDKVEGPSYCPKAMAACNVEGVLDSYECLDITSELESCGGCLHGTYGDEDAAGSGQDCTKMTGARKRSITCTSGRCVAMACTKGFTLVSGECLKLR